MTIQRTAELAFGRWPGILQAFGVDPKYLRDVHGPCPICGGKDRFRFDDKGNGEWFCNACTQKGCGKPDGFRLLQLLNGWDFKTAAKKVDEILGTIPASTPKSETTIEDKRKVMRGIARGCRPVTPGDPVWRYLESRCGDPTGYLQDIRYHPALRHSVSGGEHPAMVALCGWDGQKFSGLHRTYLTPDGRKAAVDPVRMTYGELGPVRLSEWTDALGVAEGIETAICASKRFGLPFVAALSAAGMADFTPFPGIGMVVVAGDNDESFTGQAAAYALAKRLRASGLAVCVEIPDRVNTDWCDLHQGINQVAA